MNFRTSGAVALVVFVATAALATTAIGAPTSKPKSATAVVRNVPRALCAMGFNSLPMRTLPSGHHLIEVMINGKPANFVVDTGAGATVVHKPYVDEFALKASGELDSVAIGAGGSTALSSYQVDNVTVGGTKTTLNRIAALDLSHVVNALDRIAKARVQGVIGQDIMGDQNAIIDVQEARLYLMPIAGERQIGCDRKNQQSAAR